MTYQVVTEKLHDERRVLVALLGECVELCNRVSRRSHAISIGYMGIRTSNGFIE